MINSSSADQVLFRLSLQEDGLYVNERRLHRVQFDSPNHRFMMYLLFHQTELVHFKDVIEAADLPKQTSKRLAHYLNELGFTGRLKLLFFPVTTGGYVQLRNPIVASVLQLHMPEASIPDITVDELLAS